MVTREVLEFKKTVENKYDTKVIDRALKEVEFKEGWINSAELLSSLSSLRKDNINEVVELIHVVSDFVKFRNSQLDSQKKFSYLDKDSILSRDEILEICNSLPNNRDRAIILGTFEGLKGKNYEELIGIKPEDITNEGIYIESRNSYFPASKELVQFFTDSCQDDHTFFLSENGVGNRMSLFDDGTALKSHLRGTKNPGRALYQTAVKDFDFLHTKDNISLPQIRLSGKIYYLKQIAQAMGVTPEFYLKKTIKDEFLRRFGVIGMNGKQITELIENCK